MCDLNPQSACQRAYKVELYYTLCGQQDLCHQSICLFLEMPLERCLSIKSLLFQREKNHCVERCKLAMSKSHSLKDMMMYVCLPKAEAYPCGRVFTPAHGPAPLAMPRHAAGPNSEDYGISMPCNYEGEIPVYQLVISSRVCIVHNGDPQQPLPRSSLYPLY